MNAAVDEQLKTCQKERTISFGTIIVFITATLASAILLEFFLPNSSDFNWPEKREKQSSSAQITRPKYAIYGKSKTEEHLYHVKNVLEKLGYERTSSIEDDWHVLWAHDYPFFQMAKSLKQLKNQQIVNHFPGIGFITNKVDLCTTALKFLPKAFRLPKQSVEFQKYSNLHPNAIFVVKHNEHRHIRIETPAKINLQSNESFVQEYIQKPYLVDGHKFDIGVYVVITSIDPLRAYIYTGDVLFRYCPLKYYPFDAELLDKYIVGDDYLPTWQVPSLRKYFNHFGGSMRAAFDAYVRDQRLDPTGIWAQVEQIIAATLLSKAVDIKRTLKSYQTRNFFELLRFDLIIDEKLRVHLMEANMSPNLSSAHFKANAILYEQVLYSALNLVGLGSPLKNATSLDELNECLIADKNLAVEINRCAMNSCDLSCNLEECALCLPCLSGTEYKCLQNAYREHLHRIDMKRIFPRTDNAVVDSTTTPLSKRDQWMTDWYKAKCAFEGSWCS